MAGEQARREMRKAVCEGVSTQLDITGSLKLTEHCVVLLGDPDERCPPAELFEFGGPHISAG
jgi:hypothetical protein